MDRVVSLVIESLPAIDIDIGTDRLLFLERIMDLKGDDGQLTVERHQMTLGEQELHFINLILPGSTERLKSGGQLIVRPDETWVSVEMYSADWDGNHPTRDAYIEFARVLLQPILKRYNLQFGTHHRLRIAKPKGYVMPPKTKMLFDQFAALANVRALHARDWERFYLFVRNSRSEVPEGYLLPMLVKMGFPVEKARILGQIYRHLWNFKKLRA